MGRKELSLPTVGVSSLLTVFSVLCIVMFAVLSISTVQSQRELSMVSAEMVAGYYNADAQAEELLARLRSGEMPAGVKEETGVYTYSCAVSETLSLEVEVILEGADYSISRWQMVSAAEWSSDDSLQVWSGQ